MTLAQMAEKPMRVQTAEMMSVFAENSDGRVAGTGRPGIRIGAFASPFIAAVGTWQATTKHLSVKGWLRGGAICRVSCRGERGEGMMGLMEC